MGETALWMWIGDQWDVVEAAFLVQCIFLAVSATGWDTHKRLNKTADIALRQAQGDIHLSRDIRLLKET